MRLCSCDRMSAYLHGRFLMKLFVCPNTSSPRYISAAARGIDLLEERCGAVCSMTAEKAAHDNRQPAKHPQGACKTVGGVPVLRVTESPAGPDAHGPVLAAFG